MDGIHDLGGMQGFGPPPPTPGKPQMPSGGAGNLRHDHRHDHE